MVPDCRTLLVALFTVAMTGHTLYGEEAAFIENRRFDAAEARQAVAVDAHHFYAIDNAAIGKYDRRTGKRVARWEAGAKSPLTHLNSGIVRDGRLYCAHSNYPHQPDTSSVEIWDAASLQHVDSHSFGIYEGSLTWIDRKDDSWWAVFAHYSRQSAGIPERDHRWTSLVRFDSRWRRLEAWVFPPEVLDRFAPNSCSGGAWGPDGALYCTGHDHREVYRLKLPASGSTLVLQATLPAPFTGQGIAWDHAGQIILGIDRPGRQVIAARLKTR